MQKIIPNPNTMGFIEHHTRNTVQGNGGMVPVCLNFWQQMDVIGQ
jgi:hypothetical protein